jgi:hypothetical protein
MGEFEIGEQPRHAGIVHRIAIAACLLGERAGQPRLADSARSGDQQIAVLGNPSGGRELPEQRLVEPPRRSVIDILDGGLAVAQAGGAQAHVEAPCVAVGDFAIEQQRQPLGVPKF